MNKPVNILIALLFIGVSVLGVYNFLQTHKYKTFSERTDFKGEARTNPLYAARLFLKRMGIPSETKHSLQGFGSFPQTSTVILLDTRRTTLSKAKIDQLIKWIESGGHLIAKANKDWEASDKNKARKKQSRDPLQRYLGVHVSSGSEFIELVDENLENFEDILDEVNDAKNKDKNSDKKINYPKISLKGANKKLALKDTWFRAINVDEKHQDKTEEIELSGRNYIIRQRVGEGMVTLVSDMKFIENKALGKADHAEILWYLVHGLHSSLYQPKSVWLIHNDEMPALWRLLWQYGWAFILSLLLLFIAWLLHSTRRFGPLIPKAEENRRSLNEHISSSGQFYWQHNKRNKLLQSARQALMQKLARMHPGWSQRSESEQLDIIAKQSKLSPDTLYRAMYATDIKTADEFTRTIQLLEQLRQSL